MRQSYRLHDHSDKNRWDTGIASARNLARSKDRTRTIAGQKLQVTSTLEYCLHAGRKPQAHQGIAVLMCRARRRHAYWDGKNCNVFVWQCDFMVRRFMYRPASVRSGFRTSERFHIEGSHKEKLEKRSRTSIVKRYERKNAVSFAVCVTKSAQVKDTGQEGIPLSSVSLAEAPADFIWV